MISSIAVLSSFYVLLAVGYVVVYQTSRVVNFSFGDIFMVGGYLGFVVISSLSLHPLLVFPIAVAAGAVAGMAIYRVVMSPLAGYPVFAAVLVTIGMGIVIRGLALIGFDGQVIYPGRVLKIANPPVSLFGIDLGLAYDIATIASAIAVVLGLLAFFRFSPLGVRMRAASLAPRLAAFRGINIHGLFALAWAISIAIGTYASALYGMQRQVGPSLTEVALHGLAVALVGGMDSIKGVVPAAIMVATLEIMTQRYVSPQASEAVPFLILVIVLVIRPWGFFGTREFIDRI